jgi:hypothetical protein
MRKSKMKKKTKKLVMMKMMLHLLDFGEHPDLQDTPRRSEKLGRSVDGL